MKAELRDKPIAMGRTAEIYPWHNGQVLKLFHKWFIIENIEYELRIARAVQATGLPVPSVGDIVQVNGRNGIEYERVDGISMLEFFAQNPWTLLRLARRMAELHAELHEISTKAAIPIQQEKLEFKIGQAEQLSPDLRNRILEKMKSLPTGDRLCHGDFHPANIMVHNTGETIIDWIDSSMGNPLADVARTTIIALGAVETDQFQNPTQGFAIRIFHDLYLKHYFALRPGGKDQYLNWIPVMAASRLSEGIDEQEEWLIAQAERI